MNIGNIIPVTNAQGVAPEPDQSEKAVAGMAKRGQIGGEETDKSVAEKGAAVVQKSADLERIEALRERVNASLRTRLQIDREEESGQFIYRLFDPETGEVMRQWPPEKYMDLVAFLKDQQGGVVDERV
ncbi:flagellar protein FlaG [Oceanicaulis sp.]|jgi:flagellar protein FlaG|uniref:flagellar protein FlaG n=1 Tax=Oceanicaulis sp. TaxID=1924941 RepID=UPI000D2FE3C7